MQLPSWLWDCLKLSGIVLVLAGLALRLKPTLVVVTAAILTGAIAGIPLLSEGGLVHAGPSWWSISGREGLIDMLGRAFVDNRLMTLFIITLPAIALSERFGLQRRSAELIRRMRAATPGRLLIVYQLFRVAMGMLGLRVNGHPTFVRPLVYPMALGAAAPGGDTRRLPEGAAERVKAAAAGSENYGNFYGQNLSPVQPGILLVYGVLKALGYTVSVWKLVYYAIPITVLTVLLGAAQFILFDRWLKHRLAHVAQPPSAVDPSNR